MVTGTMFCQSRDGNGSVDCKQCMGLAESYRDMSSANIFDMRP